MGSPISRHPSAFANGARRLEPWDFALLGFLASAFLAVGTAYDRPSAWVKLLAIVASVAVCALLARSTVRGTSNAAMLGGLLCLPLTTAILLRGFAAEVTPGGIGQTWPILGIDEETSVGLLTILMPFEIAGAAYLWGQARSARWLWAGACLMSATALLVAGSAGSAVALLVAAGVLSWRALAARSGARIGWGVAALGLAGLLAVVAGVAISGGLAGARATLSSRISVAQAALWLAQDFRFLGAGLQSFSGLFSRYILVEPFPYYRQSYNLFLDLTVQQGLLGLSCYVAVLAGAFRAVWCSPTPDSGDGRRFLFVRHATLACLVVGLALGIVHDPFQAPLGAAFLFLGPGLAFGLARGAVSRQPLSPVPVGVASAAGSQRPSVWAVSLGAFAAVTAVGAWPWRNVPADLAANIGAVQMAQSDLRGWPADRGPVMFANESPASAGWWFRTALRLDPHHRVANHRLGLMAMQARDFESASALLHTAWEQGQSHRGVRKALGYCYVWLGELDRAEALLRQVPEAAQELRWYARWWQARGDPHLADLSAVMSGRLEEAG
jgi:hypothetical protein